MVGEAGRNRRDDLIFLRAEKRGETVRIQAGAALLLAQRPEDHRAKHAEQ
ncbi:hypothetical protein [Bradyrhizobium sp. 2S1]|nr:hypothetical protein [Bradyrhizobium sp. 2S1]MCK7665352.1 hypothetical protein [Bradyrhizobium sp. 2S1]